MHVVFQILIVVSLIVSMGCGDRSSDPVLSSSDAAPSSSQRNPPADLAAGEQQIDTSPGPIATIQAQYGEIQRMLDAGELRADTLTFTCQTEDGEFFLVRHFDGEEVVMMRTTTGIGHAFTTRRMYFQDGELFFAWWQDEQFSPAEPPEGAGEELGWRSSYTETRYYVEGGKVIRQLTKTYEEASWNDNLASEAIPNQPVDVPPGTPYPDLDALENWKAGEVDC